MSDLLLGLRTFVQVAERLNFTAVAMRSHASHTTVARRIDQLEGHFGVKLFTRSTRRMSLTPEGERLLDHARTVVEEMERAESDLAGAFAARGVVRVGVTTALGLHYAERLTVLRDRHPELRVEFAVADWQDNLIESGMDLALRVGAPVSEWPSIQRLGPIHRQLVATPAYLAQRGTPGTVQDLTGHDCIAYGYGTTPAVWEIEGERLPISGCFRANSSEAVFRAVTHHLGIGLLPTIQVRSAIAAGQIVPVLPDALIEPLLLSVIDRFAANRMPARVRAVHSFLHEEFPKTDPARPSPDGQPGADR